MKELFHHCTYTGLKLVARATPIVSGMRNRAYSFDPPGLSLLFFPPKIHYIFAACTLPMDKWDIDRLKEDIKKYSEMR